LIKIFGISLRRNQTLRLFIFVLKLYDISRLFNQCTELSLIRDTFKRSAEVELKYRELKGKTHVDVLEDMFQTSTMIAVRGKKRDATKYKEITDGIRAFSSYVAQGNFSIEAAIVCASHAAYISNLLRNESVFEIKRFDPNVDLSNVQIEGDFKYLNRLKKGSPEAFFYFKEAIDIYE